MFKKLSYYKNNKFFKATTLGLLLAFVMTFAVPAPARAQGLLGLPNPGTMVHLSSGFIPTILRGIRVYPDNPLKFDFIVDSGNTGLEGEALKAESEKIIKYFLACLTIPEKDLWVNLSPYEKDRIAPDALGATELGRDLLAQDYMLKQITSSLMYPEDDFGKAFWKKIYKQAYEQYGTTEVPVNTFNKVWIVPEKATIYQKGDKAFIVSSRMKVMLEEDYLALSQNENNEHFGGGKQTGDDIQKLTSTSSQVVREIIIPELEKEVNEGKNFAQLRQITNSLILAVWFKKNLQSSILNKIYSDQNKISGVHAQDQEIKNKIYDQYLKAFKTGVYDYLKVDYDPNTKRHIPRKYFSGGYTTTLTRMEPATTADGEIKYTETGAVEYKAVETTFGDRVEISYDYQQIPQNEKNEFVQVVNGMNQNQTTFSVSTDFETTAASTTTASREEFKQDAAAVSSAVTQKELREFAKLNGEKERLTSKINKLEGQVKEFESDIEKIRKEYSDKSRIEKMFSTSQSRIKNLNKSIAEKNIEIAGATTERNQINEKMEKWSSFNQDELIKDSARLLVEDQRFAQAKDQEPVLQKSAVPYTEMVSVLRNYIGTQEGEGYIQAIKDMVDRNSKGSATKLLQEGINKGNMDNTDSIMSLFVKKHFADPEEAAREIITNAYDSMKHLPLEKRVVSISTKDGFTVTDEGEGMSLDTVLRKLFIPFSSGKANADFTKMKNIISDSNTNNKLRKIEEIIQAIDKKQLTDVERLAVDDIVSALDQGGSDALKKIENTLTFTGQFGIGFYSILYFVQNENDSVEVITSTGKEAHAIKYFVKDGNIQVSMAKLDHAKVKQGTTVSLKSASFRKGKAKEVIEEYLSFNDNAQLRLDGNLVNSAIFEEGKFDKLSDSTNNVKVYSSKDKGNFSEVYISVHGVTILKAYVQGVNIPKKVVFNYPANIGLPVSRNSVDFNDLFLDKSKAIVDLVSNNQDLVNVFYKIIPSLESNADMQHKGKLGKYVVNVFNRNKDSRKIYLPDNLDLSKVSLKNLVPVAGDLIRNHYGNDYDSIDDAQRVKLPSVEGKKEEWAQVGGKPVYAVKFIDSTKYIAVPDAILINERNIPESATELGIYNALFSTSKVSGFPINGETLHREPVKTQIEKEDVRAEKKATAADPGVQKENIAKDSKIKQEHREEFNHMVERIKHTKNSFFHDSMILNAKAITSVEEVNDLLEMNNFSKGIKEEIIKVLLLKRTPQEAALATKRIKNIERDLKIIESTGESRELFYKRLLELDETLYDFFMNKLINDKGDSKKDILKEVHQVAWTFRAIFSQASDDKTARENNEKMMKLYSNEKILNLLKSDWDKGYFISTILKNYDLENIDQGINRLIEIGPYISAQGLDSKTTKLMYVDQRIYDLYKERVKQVKNLETELGYFFSAIKDNEGKISLDKAIENVTSAMKNKEIQYLLSLIEQAPEGWQIVGLKTNIFREMAQNFDPKKNYSTKERLAVLKDKANFYNADLMVRLLIAEEAIFDRYRPAVEKIGNLKSFSEGLPEHEKRARELKYQDQFISIKDEIDIIRYALNFAREKNIYSKDVALDLALSGWINKIIKDYDLSKHAKIDLITKIMTKSADNKVREERVAEIALLTQVVGLSAKRRSGFFGLLEDVFSEMIFLEDIYYNHFKNKIRSYYSGESDYEADVVRGKRDIEHSIRKDIEIIKNASERYKEKYGEEMPYSFKEGIKKILEINSVSSESRQSLIYSILEKNKEAHDFYFERSEKYYSLMTGALAEILESFLFLDQENYDYYEKLFFERVKVDPQFALKLENLYPFKSEMGAMFRLEIKSLFEWALTGGDISFAEKKDYSYVKSKKLKEFIKLNPRLLFGLNKESILNLDKQAKAVEDGDSFPYSVAVDEYLNQLYGKESKAEANNWQNYLAVVGRIYNVNEDVLRKLIDSVWEYAEDPSFQRHTPTHLVQTILNSSLLRDSEVINHFKTLEGKSILGFAKIIMGLDSSDFIQRKYGKNAHSVFMHKFAPSLAKIAVDVHTDLLSKGESEYARNLEALMKFFEGGEIDEMAREPAAYARYILSNENTEDFVPPKEFNLDSATEFDLTSLYDLYLRLDKKDLEKETESETLSRVNAASKERLNSSRRTILNNSFKSAIKQAVDGFIFLREAVQNAIDAVVESNLNNQNMTINTYHQKKEDNEVLSGEKGNLAVLEIKDGVGMDVQRIVNSLLMPFSSTKKGDKRFIGEQGQGFFTLLKQSRYVDIKSTKDNKTTFARIIPIIEGGEIVDFKVSLKTSVGEAPSGTTFNVFIETENAKMDSEVIRSTLEKYTRFVDNGILNIQYNGDLINNKKADFVSRHQTSLGELKFYAAQGENALTHNGLYVKEIDHEMEKHIPPLIKKMLLKYGVVIDIPRSLELIQGRSDVLEKEKNYKLMGKEISLAAIETILNLFSMGKINFDLIAYDYASLKYPHRNEDSRAISDIQRIEDGKVNEINFDRYKDETNIVRLLLNMPLITIFGKKRSIIGAMNLINAQTEASKVNEILDLLPDKLAQDIRRENFISASGDILGDENKNAPKMEDSALGEFKEELRDADAYFAFAEMADKISELMVEKLFTNIQDPVLADFKYKIESFKRNPLRWGYYYTEDNSLAHAVQSSSRFSWNLAAQRNNIQMLSNYLKGRISREEFIEGAFQDIVKTITHETVHLLEESGENTHNSSFTKRQIAILNSLVEAGEAVDQMIKSLQWEGNYIPSDEFIKSGALGEENKNLFDYIVGGEAQNSENKGVNTGQAAPADQEAVQEGSPSKKEEGGAVGSSDIAAKKNPSEGLGGNLKGGIDLDSANLDMDIQGDTIEFQMPQSLQGIDPAQIQGFIPVIINVTPIANFYSLLEIPEEEQLSLLNSVALR